MSEDKDIAASKNAKSILTQKSRVFLIRMIYAILGVSGTSLTVTLYHHTYGAILANSIIIIINIFCLVALRHNYRLAKVISISTITIALSGIITFYPIEVGLYTFYLPISIAGFVLFADEARQYKLIFSASIIVLSILTVVFKANMGISLPISAADIRFSYNFNFLLALMFTWACIDFFMRTNAETEHQLEELAITLETKNEQLEHTNNDLDRLIYSTTHDLRSPLASVRGLLDIASHETQDEKLQEYFLMMNDRLTKLDHFILDMLELSKHSKENVKNSEVDLSELVNEVMENLQFMDGFNKIEHKIEVCSPHKVFTDRHKIAAIISNLVSNAVKYHDYTKTSPYIKIKVSYVDQLLKIIVEDNGLGISKENKENIFKMFYRASQQSYGSGLGLAIVAYTLEKLNGKIEVESESGKGTVFIVTIPAERALQVA